MSPEGLRGRGFIQQEPMVVMGREDSKWKGPETARSRLRGMWPVVREGGNIGDTSSVSETSEGLGGRSGWESLAKIHGDGSSR